MVIPEHGGQAFLKLSKAVLAQCIDGQRSKGYLASTAGGLGFGKDKAIFGFLQGCHHLKAASV